MTLKIANDMFEATLKVFERMYPEKTNLVIQFDPVMQDKKKTGYLLLPEKDSGLTDIFVFINANLNVIDASTALVELLADIAVGLDNKNEFVWRKTYNELMKESEKELVRMFKSLNLDQSKFDVTDENGKEIDFDDDEE